MQRHGQPDHDIGENQTLWINLTLTFQPTENSRIKGYVIDNETHAAVRNAFIRYDWKDDVGHFYSKSTFTDQKGYYSIISTSWSCSIFYHRKWDIRISRHHGFLFKKTANSWLNSTLDT